MNNIGQDGQYPNFKSSQLRDFMERHQELTLEDCLKEYNKYMKQKIDETYQSNVANIKKYFNDEVQSKALHPTTFNELASRTQE